MSLSKRFPYFSVRRTALALLGSAILSFGLYNIHAFSGVTEGGVLGLTLLLHHWFGISPSVSGLILNALCYVAGWKTLGQSFIFYSIIAGGGFSAFYAIFERFDPLWPSLAQMPIERIYLASDLIVLALSATYLPLDRLGCSLLTVILSGQLIGLIQRIPSPKHLQKEAAE